MDLSYILECGWTAAMLPYKMAYDLLRDRNADAECGSTRMIGIELFHHVYTLLSAVSKKLRQICRQAMVYPSLQRPTGSGTSRNIAPFSTTTPLHRAREELQDASDSRVFALRSVDRTYSIAFD